MEAPLEKFIGDAVMAVFGLPHAHSDDAERALAAALALREAVATDTLLRRCLLLRMGSNTGEVVATNNPSGDNIMVSGDAVNVAARLQQAASFGEILVSERTATSGTQAAFFSFMTRRQVEVKGKRHPLRVFPLSAGASIAAGRAGQRWWVDSQGCASSSSCSRERTLAEQRPHLISIVAPAGTGKTRLLEEFLTHLNPVEGFQVAVARCPPYGQTLIYWPLRDLLTGLLGEAIGKPQVVDAFCTGGTDF